MMYYPQKLLKMTLTKSIIEKNNPILIGFLKKINENPEVLKEVLAENSDLLKKSNRREKTSFFTKIFFKLNSLPFSGPIRFRMYEILAKFKEIELEAEGVSFGGNQNFQKFTIYKNGKSIWEIDSPENLILVVDKVLDMKE